MGFKIYKCHALKAGSILGAVWMAMSFSPWAAAKNVPMKPEPRVFSSQQDEQTSLAREIDDLISASNSQEPSDPQGDAGEFEREPEEDDPQDTEFEMEAVEDDPQESPHDAQGGLMPKIYIVVAVLSFGIFMALFTYVIVSARLNKRRYK